MTRMRMAPRRTRSRARTMRMVSIVMHRCLKEIKECCLLGFPLCCGNNDPCKDNECLLAAYQLAAYFVSNSPSLEGIFLDGYFKPIKKELCSLIIVSVSFGVIYLCLNRNGVATQKVFKSKI